ncbi:MAG: NADH-quinone oxidoreductase subunit C [bacterium]|nr:NADH-quinone oxidoreductase subunit C [bacterium]
MMLDPITRFRERFWKTMVKFDQRSAKRIYIEFRPIDVPEAVRYLTSTLRARFVIMSGVDIPEGIELLYHLSFDGFGKIVTLRTRVNKDSPQIESIAPIIEAASWIEREIAELLGVEFIGHPHPGRLLLAEDWLEGCYPLRSERHKP